MSPRVLKLSLRRCFEFWNENPGEIDFDVLLVASILYNFDPVVFSAMKSHSAEWVASLPERQRSDSQEDSSAGFLMGRGYQGQELLAVQLAVKFLLGKEGPGERLQGFSSVHGKVKYWDRFLSSPYIPEEDSDQALLKILEHGSEAKLLDLLEGPRSSSIEHFSRLLRNDVILRLLLALVERRNGEPHSFISSLIRNCSEEAALPHSRVSKNEGDSGFMVVQKGLKSG
ncbi:MAG TPA: hypothetical protein VJ600_08195 [Holophagaceae bacterium]|nr:hypothetical protein [Holophagaceae bacterium]